MWRFSVFKASSICASLSACQTFSPLGAYRYLPSSVNERGNSDPRNAAVSGRASRSQRS